MTLESGRRLGLFEVISPLGAGGMGEVYRAKDTRLGREVALKVLPSGFAARPDRRARFEREARLLASLGHPGIATIHGFEEAEGVPFLVLELVEGQTLRQRLDRGALPAPEAMEVACQIAVALEAAHEKGIVHRDLKPSNVMLPRDGRVKLLDFGLAKAMTVEGHVGSEWETESGPASRTGLVLGTSPYMSPEQARGEVVDERTDVWAFGCVLYEMLTGRRAFAGATTSDTVAAVLSEEPDWKLLPASLPEAIRRLLQRCLRKDLSQRLHDIADVRIEASEALLPPSGPEARGHGPAKPVRTFVALLVVLCAGALGRLLSVPNGSPRMARRAVVGIPSDIDGSYLPFALSPDGKRFAYATGLEEGGRAGRLYVRSFDSFVTQPLDLTENAYDPFFSPDGRSLAFYSQGLLKKIELPAGPVTTLCEIKDLCGGSWGDDARIVFATDANAGGLMWVGAAGGEPHVLTRPNGDVGEVAHLWPQVLPGAKAVLYTVRTRSERAPFRVDALSLASGEHHTVVEDASYARYVPTGHLLFARHGLIAAGRFDLARLGIVGPTQTVVEDVVVSTLGGAQFSVGADGTLAYAPPSTVPEQSLVWVDRTGRATPLPAPKRAYYAPRLSPDGARVAVAILDAIGGDTWIYDLQRENLSRFTFDNSADSLGLWSLDSRSLAYTRVEPEGYLIVSRGVDGSAPEMPLFRSKERVRPTLWSVDGKILGVATGFGKFYATRPADGTAALVLDGPSSTAPANLSPDGRFLVYSSAESGEWNVYVESFPRPGAKRQISSAGGREPRWSPEGGEIFYREGTRMMSVAVRTAPTFVVGKPRALFQGDFARGSIGETGYDVTSDGRRFLMVETDPAGSRPVRVVFDWFEELKQQVP